MRLEVILRGFALRYPDKIALVCGDEEISYRALDLRIRSVAHGLHKAGVRPGHHILAYLPNSIEVIELFYAAFTLGAIVVPVVTRLTASELEYICNDVKPFALVFEDFNPAVSSVTSTHPDAIRIAINPGSDDAISFSSLRTGLTELLPRIPASQDDALISYSSGTTGRPKGAILTHSNFIIQHRFLNTVEWGISSDDRFLVTTPLAHRTGFARLVNAFTLGGTLVVMKKFDPRDAVETIGREKVTVAGMVPTICRMLIPEIRRNPAACESLRRLVVTGEAFPVALKKTIIELLPDVRLVSFFAMTEVGAITSLTHEEQFDHPASIGQPVPGVEIRIVDDAGQDVKTGDAGELLVWAGVPGIYSVMREYFKNPEENRKTIRDGWVHTGDMAKADELGYLYIVDRKKDMIVSGGFNIYTKEVEQALLQNQDIGDAAVVGVPDDVYGEAVTAFVELKPGASATPASIIAHVRQFVAGYKKPKTVFVVKSLPRNSLGKVLKQELRAMARQTAENAHSN